MTFDIHIDNSRMRNDKKVLKSTQIKATKEVVCASKDFVYTAIKSLGDLILALNMTKKSRHRHRYRQYHHHIINCEHLSLISLALRTFSSKVACLVAPEE